MIDPEPIRERFAALSQRLDEHGSADVCGGRGEGSWLRPGLFLRPSHNPTFQSLTASQGGADAPLRCSITFQAPEFYPQHGYRELGRVKCDPPGHTRICFTKRLSATDGSDQ